MKLRMFAGFDLLDRRADHLNLSLRRGRALIAYLAMKEDRSETREYLVDLLWPGRFREQAQASLRQVLFEIRKKPPDDKPLLVASRSDVSLGPAIDECDVWAFDHCATTNDPADAEHALNLYRGPFLDGPSLGAEPFQQWAAIQRARLEGQLESIVLNAAAECRATGSDSRACGMLERLLQVSPLCYQAAMLLLQTEAENDRVAEALRKYERYVRHLKLEYDEEPPGELRDIYEMLTTSPLQRPRMQRLRRREAYTGADPWRRTANDAPILAVLPFRCLTDNAFGQELAVAMSEDITLMLSGCRWFKVLSRSATHSVDSNEPRVIEDFVQRTGVNYLIYGAVMERGDKWSITVELADSLTGVIEWAKRFDAANDEIIHWARELCPQIVAALDPALADSETAIARKPALSATGSIAAYQHLVAGYRRFYAGEWKSALEKFEQATAQDETYAHAHAMAAVTVYLDAQVHRRDLWREELADAEIRARRALEIDPSEAKACNILGQILDWQGKHERSLHYLDKAVGLNPSFAWASTAHSYHAVMTGEFEQAKSYIRTAMRLRVGDAGLGLCLPARALADLHLGNVDDALETAHWATRLRPEFWLGKQVLAASLRAAGNDAAARTLVEEIRSEYPGLSSAEFAGWFPYQGATADRPVLDTLRRFGWD